MGTGSKLLLADDSITIQKVVNLTFADEGMEVTTVGNGDLAIQKIEQSAPDIVLADVHMPGSNGYEVCEFVKRNERFRHIPVMLLVGSFEPFDEAEARRVGADDFLTKPFLSIRQLVSKVGALLSGKSSTDDAPTRDLSERADANARGGAQAAPSAFAESYAESSSTQAPAEDAGMRPETSFADLDMDDGLIETTPVTDISANRTTGGEHRLTTPMSAADLAEAGIDLNQTSPHQGHDTLRMNVTEPLEQPVAAIATTHPGLNVTHTGLPSVGDEALLELGDAQPLRVPRLESDAILDIFDYVPESEPAAIEYAGEVVEATPAEHSESRFPSQPYATAPSWGDDSSMAPRDLQMEAEAAGLGAVTTPLEPIPPQGVESVSSALESHTEVSADSDAAPVPRTGLITLDQLAPEVIDEIARRAVEKLSAKVVEEVAWEVVPQLAELLIKRRMEEQAPQSK